MKKSPYRVEFESPYKCLYSGFEPLGRRDGHEKTFNVMTKRGQLIQRRMKSVSVDQYSLDNCDKKEFHSFLGVFYADCVTGTLYDKKTGKSLTSDQMWIVK